jgi:UDP-N-acetylglucosamine diphosphorylase/glucosamine-1-phosphate N-acetyltransferase
MRINLNDNGFHLRFAPLTLTRPLGNLRIGIFTNDERWKKLIESFDPTIKTEIGFTTEEYLQGKFKKQIGAIEVNAAIIPNEEIVATLFQLEEGNSLYTNETWIATVGTETLRINYTGNEPILIEQRWDIYQKNELVLKQDFELVTAGRKSQPLSKTNTLIGDKKDIFLEEGAVVEASILNTNAGPIYIGKHSEIMEGSIVRGPLAMCEYSALKLGAKVYGASTLGPHCKVGGEINNVVFQAFSNKGHDGFLGNSIIGEWCNLGADTNTSNLKNNYGNVSTYSYEENKEVQTNLQFMGLCMGDHSKCGINTMFNTATVVGVSCNVFGADFPSKFIPSFSWGGGNGFESFKFNKAIEYANNMMNRRGIALSHEEIEILQFIENKK